MVNNTAKGRLYEVAMSYTANLLAGMYNNKFHIRTSLSIVGSPYILTKCLGGSPIAAGSTNQEPASLLFPPTNKHIYIILFLIAYLDYPQWD